MLDALLDDLRAEHDDLRRYVATADLCLAVPAEPWDVRDTVSHLLVGTRRRCSRPPTPTRSRPSCRR